MITNFSGLHLTGFWTKNCHQLRRKHLGKFQIIWKLPEVKRNDESRKNLALVTIQIYKSIFKSNIICYQLKIRTLVTCQLCFCATQKFGDSHIQMRKILMISRENYLNYWSKTVKRKFSFLEYVMRLKKHQWNSLFRIAANIHWLCNISYNELHKTKCKPSEKRSFLGYVMSLTKETSVRIYYLELPSIAIGLARFHMMNYARQNTNHQKQKDIIYVSSAFPVDNSGDLNVHIEKNIDAFQRR